VSTWITRRPEAEVAAEVADADPALPLAGLRLGVKDNIDVAGLPTTAGCPAFAYEPGTSAPVVERLVAAGAVVVGKTNLDQFATGLVGTRNPYGALESPLAPGRVSGGSSSGSAVAVATGEVDVALGTDTAGSGRVPAAFCGIVGLKPTPGWLSLRGVVPASSSFDCVSMFARDVATAALALEVAAGFDDADPRSARPAPDGVAGGVRRIGVPSTAVVSSACTPGVTDAFHRVVAGLADQGFEVVEVDLTAYLDAGGLLYGGALRAERYASVGAFIEDHREEVDPVVAGIILAAKAHLAHELVTDLGRLRRLQREADRVWDRVDAVLVPTVPDHPTLDEVAAAPVEVNLALGRFTNGCNLVGWCGAAVPAGTWGDGLPFGVTLLGPAWSDRSVWAAAAAIAGQGPPAAAPAGPEVRLAVCGAHLAGQPLHHQLADRGARLVARTTTAPAYRMVRLPTVPPKPGVVRVPEGGAALEVEVWALDPEGFGSFVDGVPAPLSIGTVELADGTEVNGFLCEPHAITDAEDITAHGGWRAWLASVP
jgi:allophanate hydrolase